MSAEYPKFSHINSNYFTIFEREFHVALEDGDFFGSTISGVDIEISLSIPIPDFYV